MAELAVELDRHNIPYVLGGSLASSLVGEPRGTVDIDLAVQIDHQRLERFLNAVADSDYVPTSAAKQAVDEHTSFNQVHYQLSRRVRMTVGTDPEVGLWVTSPENNP